MAVLISLSMIVSVSKEAGRRCQQLSLRHHVKEVARTAEAGLASAQVEEQGHAKGGYDGGIRTCGSHSDDVECTNVMTTVGITRVVSRLDETEETEIIADHR